MSTTLNASTSSGFVQTADTSGTLELQSNGTTQLTVASTGAYGTLKSATTQASTSGTSIDFTSIPSWAKRITVMFNGVSTNGTSNLFFQLGDSGGIETTGYSGYAWIPSTSATSTSGAVLTGTNGASSLWSGLITVCTLGGNIWAISGVIGASGVNAPSMTGFSKTLSDTLDRIRITTVNGTDTFDAGSINIIYEG